MALKKTVKKTVKSAPKKVAKSAGLSKCSCEAKKGSKAAVAQKTESKLTRVIVKYNAGWGNQVFIRGVGAGLDWNKGVMLQCMGDDEWLWEARVPCGSVSFKLLVNDESWAQGEDQTVVSGETIICHPQF